MRLATASALFVLGVAAAFGAGISPADTTVQLAVLATAIALSLTVASRLVTRKRSVFAIGALILVLGFARGAAAGDGPGQNWLNVPTDGQQVTLTAWLNADANRAGSGVRLTLRALSIDDAPADFPVTVFASGLSDLTGSGRTSNGFRYGDVYTFGGRFSTASGEFAAASAGTVFTGVVSLVEADHGNPARRSVAGVREWLSNNLDRTIGEPASALAAAMLVGNRTGISEQLNLEFRESGTSHILAISGLHVALISGLAMAVSASLLGRRGQYYLLIPLAVTWGYAALAGFSPSVTRAAIMFSVGLLARAAGRQNASLPGIGFAAAVMVAISPEILRSLSFQLSFAAISGIAVLTPRLISAADRLMPGLRLSERNGNRLAAALVGTLAVSVAATLITWPLVAMNFGGAPVWGGIATVVMLPAVPLLIIISGVASLAAGVSTQAGEVIGWPAWLLSEFIVGVARLFKDLPPGVVNTEGWGSGAAVLAYAAIYLAFSWDRVRAVLISAVTRIWQTLAQPFSEHLFVRSGVPAWSIVVAAAVAAVAWAGVVTSAGGDELTVTFFETDRGDMVLVRTPNGNSALIDGGRDPFGAVRSLDSALPFWDRSLDLLLVTHPDADHVGGLQAVIERYDVTTIAEAPTTHGSTIYAAWRRAVDERGGSVTLDQGVLIALDDGVTLEVLSAGRPFPDATINDASVVTMLRYGDVSMLLTGDITSVIERRLLDSGRDIGATVLKVPHHGSDTSSTGQFLDAVDPEVAIIQVGSDNRFGHPTADVLSRLEAVVPEESLFITSRDGDVIVRTDGVRLWVSAER